jgi:hypothetical protein
MEIQLDRPLTPTRYRLAIHPCQGRATGDDVNHQWFQQMTDATASHGIIGTRAFLLLVPVLAALQAAPLASTLPDSLTAAPFVSGLATPLNRIDGNATSRSSWLSTKATELPCLCHCKAKRWSALVTNCLTPSCLSPSCNQALQEEENEEAAGFLVIFTQLHHHCQELGGAEAAQRTDGQQPLNPLILGVGMLL